MTAQDTAIAALAAKLSTLQGDVDTLKRGARSAQLTNSSIDDGTLEIRSTGGTRRSVWGTFVDGTVGTIYLNGPTPGTPNPPTVAAHELAIVVYWDGTFTGDGGTPKDLARVDVHVGDTPGYTPDGTSLRQSLQGEGGCIIPADIGTKYVRLVAVSNAGVASVATDVVSGDPLPASNLAANSVGADQLQANSITAGALAADMLITNHLYMQDTVGDTTIDMDGATGAVYIAGQYATAADGERIVINDDNAQGYKRISFYPDTGNHPAVVQGDTQTVGGVDYGVVEMRAADPVDGSGILGRVRVFENLVTMAYGSPAIIGSGGTITTPENYAGEVTCDTNGIHLTSTTLEVTAGLVNMWADASINPTPAYNFLFRDTTGATVGNWLTLVNGASDSPVLRGVNKNSGLLFGANRLYAQDGAGSNGPFQCTTLYYTSQTSVSGRAAKRDINPVPFTATDVVAAAPSYQWIYDEAVVSGDGGTVHIGPMAEDLPEVLTSVDDATGQPAIRMDSLTGTLWQAVGELTRRVNNLTNPHSG